MTETTPASKPLVSVVIPTHDRVAELRNAVRSAWAQTFTDLEVIVVDDASPEPIARWLGDVDGGRLRIVRRAERGGGGAARNTGIAHARGRFIAFLDSDDRWTPNKVAVMLDLLTSTGAAIGLSGFTAIRGSRRMYAVPGLLGRDAFTSLITLRGGPMTASCLVVDRAVVDSGHRFDERLPALQDHDFVTRGAVGFPVACSAEPLVDKFIDSGREHTFTIKNQRDALDLLLSSHEPLFERVPVGRGRYLEALGLAEMRLGHIEAARTALERAARASPSFRTRSLATAGSLGKTPFLAVSKVLRVSDRRSLRLAGRRARDYVRSVYQPAARRR